MARRLQRFQDNGKGVPKVKLRQSFETPICLFCAMQMKPDNGFHTLETIDYTSGIPETSSMTVKCPT